MKNIFQHGSKEEGHAPVSKFITIVKKKRKLIMEEEFEDMCNGAEWDVDDELRLGWGLTGIWLRDESQIT